MLMSLCPMIICKTLISRPASAHLVQNVCLSICGFICGSRTGSLCSLSAFITSFLLYALTSPSTIIYCCLFIYASKCVVPFFFLTVSECDSAFFKSLCYFLPFRYTAQFFFSWCYAVHPATLYKTLFLHQNIDRREKASRYVPFHLSI